MVSIDLTDDVSEESAPATHLMIENMDIGLNHNVLLIKNNNYYFRPNDICIGLNFINIVCNKSTICPHIMNHTSMCNFVKAVYDNNESNIELYGKMVQKDFKIGEINVWAPFTKRKMHKLDELEHIVLYIFDESISATTFLPNSIKLMDNHNCDWYRHETHAIVKMLQIIFDNDKYCNVDSVKKNIHCISFWQIQSGFHCGPCTLLNYLDYLYANGIINLDVKPCKVEELVQKQIKLIRGKMSNIYHVAERLSLPKDIYRASNQQWFFDGRKCTWNEICQSESFQKSEQARILELQEFHLKWKKVWG